MDMLQTIDVGLVVIDRDYRVQLRNSFMQNHSGRAATAVMGKNLFRVFPDIQEDWFRRKADSVFQLSCPALYQLGAAAVSFSLQELPPDNRYRRVHVSERHPGTADLGRRDDQARRGDRT